MPEYGHDSRSAVEPPQARVYRHRKCGELTQVGGADFVALANPFVSVSGTICCTCRRGVPLRQVEWVETGEDVASYRKRLRAATPTGRRWLFRCLGPVVGVVVGLIVGFPCGLLMIGRVGNGPWWSQTSGLVFAGVSAFGGVMLGSQFVTAPLMRHLWGLDYRGER